jgi:hypothetical protein
MEFVMNLPVSSDALVAIVLLILAALGAWLYSQRLRSRDLARRFGPEYQRAVKQHGNVTKAEKELRAREQRVHKLKIVPLPAREAAHFRDAWNGLQARFVDDPRTVLKDAELLVRDVMLRRGYPMADFDRQAADISVDHPHVVDHYRAARRIADLDARGEAGTEDLRKGLVHLRALFQDLLEVETPQPAVHHQPQAARR